MVWFLRKLNVFEVFGCWKKSSTFLISSAWINCWTYSLVIPLDGFLTVISQWSDNVIYFANNRFSSASRKVLIKEIPILLAKQPFRTNRLVSSPRSCFELKLVQIKNGWLEIKFAFWKVAFWVLLNTPISTA